MDINLWQIIKWVAGFVVGIGVAIPYVVAIKKVLKETTELLVAIHDALKDDKLNKEEVHKILDEARDVKPAILALWKKIRQRR